MKTIIKTLIMASMSILFSILLIGIFADQTLAKEIASKITFEETKHDFGKVTEGVGLTFVYKFKNEGDENLVIQKVRASCGCTGATMGEKKNLKMVKKERLK